MYNPELLHTSQLTEGSFISCSNFCWTALWKTLVSYRSSPNWPLRAASTGLSCRNMTRSGFGSPTSGCLHQSREKPWRRWNMSEHLWLLSQTHNTVWRMLRKDSPAWHWWKQLQRRRIYLPQEWCLAPASSSLKACGQNYFINVAREKGRLVSTFTQSSEGWS